MNRIAIQGIAGSYSEEAVRELFSADVSIVECADFEKTLSAVRLGRAEHAVVPVENKIAGQIEEITGLLSTGDFKVLERLRLPIRHVLAGTPDAEFAALTSVRSHIEALKQCRNFLASHPHLTQHIGGDTASSIQRIVTSGDSTHAAIGSRRAVELYGAKILREDIADDDENWTVFYLVGN